MNHWQRHKAGLDIDVCLGQVATSDSVGQVATSDSVGQVATSDSVGQVATSDSVGQVATSDSVGQVATSDSVGQVATSDSVRQETPGNLSNLLFSQTGEQISRISDETKHIFVWPNKRSAIRPFTHAHNNSKG